MLRAIFISFAFLLVLTTSAQNWNQIQKQVDDHRNINEQYGWSMSIDGDYAVIGAIGEQLDANETNPLSGAGAAFVLQKDSADTWNIIQKLIASDRSAQDSFGWDVVIHGETIMVSAIFDSEDSTGSNFVSGAGSVYVFKRDSSNLFIEKQKITPLFRNTNDQFGYSLDLQGDFAVIGANLAQLDSNNQNAISEAGSAFIFERSAADNWVQNGKLTAPIRTAQDQFGNAVAISDKYISVAAHNYNFSGQGQNYVENAGAVFIYERTGNNWAFIQMVHAINRDPNDHFGNDLDMYQDIVAVGCMQCDSDAHDVNPIGGAGAVYLFQRGLATGIFQQVDKLVAYDRAFGDGFGSSLDIDNGLLIIGAQQNDLDSAGLNPISNSGAAYMFEDGSGLWAIEEKISYSDRVVSGSFGFEVALSGNNAFVSSPYIKTDENNLDTLHNAGANYVFSGNNCANSYQSINLTACNDYLSPSGNFFFSTDKIFTDTIPNACGKDSVISINLNIQQLDTSVTIAHPSLMANGSALSYQWIDCSTGSAIVGANSSVFSPSQDGQYAVVLTIASCSDTSNCRNFALASLPDLEKAMRIYPNPVKDYLNIDFDGDISQVQVFNLQGELLLTSAENRIDFSSLPSGGYIITVLTKSSFYKQLIVRE